MRKSFFHIKAHRIPKSKRLMGKNNASNDPIGLRTVPREFR